MSYARPITVREEMALRILCSLLHDPETVHTLEPSMSITEHAVAQADDLMQVLERTRPPRPQMPPSEPAMRPAPTSVPPGPSPILESKSWWRR